MRLSKRFAMGAILCMLILGANAHAQTIVRSFDGDSGPGLAVCQTGRTHCGWPDMDAAVNGKQVVQVTWQNVSVYDYAGKPLRVTPMEEFIRKAGLNPIPHERRGRAGPHVPGPYEPHIVFDEFAGRWIVTVMGSSDSLLVSASADALGSWGGVNLSCLDGGPCLDIDPALHIGYDKNGIYYCGAHLGEGNPNTIKDVAYDCFAVPTAEVGGIAARMAPRHINRAHRMPLDIIPAIDHNPEKAPGAPAFFAAKTCDRSVPGGCQNAKNYAFEWLLEAFTWSGATGTYSEQLVKTDIGSERDKWLYNKPCCGRFGMIPQAGNDTVALRGVESHRFTNVSQYGSHVHGVLTSGPCTSDCGSQGADANNLAFWVDLDCSNPKECAVAQTAKIGGPAVNPSFATVGVDSAGNVGIVAASWTPATDLSIVLWTHRASDPPNTIHGPVTVAAGTKPYTCTNENGFANIANPAGVLTALDPADGTRLWTTEQWGNNAEPCVWSTRIFEYQIGGANPGGGRRAKRKSAK